MIKGKWQYKSKKVYRNILKEFIRKHYSYGEFNKLKVACFPGEDAAEIFEVYDQLGIERRNIFGIERDKKIVQRLKDADLGIKIFSGDALDLFKNYLPPIFDVINLDFYGMQTDYTIEVIKYITARSFLSSNSILGTNFFGSREKFDLQMDYYHDLTRKDRLVKKGEDTTKQDSSLDEIFKFKESRKISSLNSVRSDSITTRIIERCLVANTNFFELHPDSVKTIMNIRFNDKNEDENVIGPKDNESSVYYTYTITQHDTEKKIIEEAEKTSEQIEHDLILNSEDLIYAYQLALQHRPFFIKDIKRISYPGIGGHHMFSDFLYLERENKLFPITLKQINQIKNVDDNSSYKKISKHNRVLNKAKRVMPLIRKAYKESYEFPTRETLDKKTIESYEHKLPKSIKLTEIINNNLRKKNISIIESFNYSDNRVNIMQGIKTGLCDNFLKEHFNLTSCQLGSYKTWLKRGLLEKLLNQKDSSESPVKQKEESSNFESYIHLTYGFPDEFLMSKFQLKKMQLAGYKASLKKDNNNTKKVYSIISTQPKSEVIDLIRDLSLETKVILVDSDLVRGLKNKNRIKSTAYVEVKNNPKDSSSIYLINSFSEKNSNDLTDIAIMYSDSIIIPNIIAISNISNNSSILSTTEQLHEMGCRFRLFLYESSGGYINGNGLTLEKILSKSDYHSFIV